MLARRQLYHRATRARMKQVPLRPIAACRDTCRSENLDASGERQGDNHRQVATIPDSSRYVAQVERENEFRRGQVDVKDKQIAELSELYRRIHVLAQRSSAIAGASDRHARSNEAHHAFAACSLFAPSSPNPLVSAVSPATVPNCMVSTTVLGTITIVALCFKPS